MAGSLNKCMIIGRLGKDPEVKYTKGGQGVTSFSIATDEGYTKDGVKTEKTEWHRICAWGKLAELCGNYLHKGSLVYVEGKLQTRQWEKDGQKMYTTEIVIFTMQFLENKGDNQGQTPPQDSQNKGHNQQQGGNSTNTSKGTAGMDNTPF